MRVLLLGIKQSPLSPIIMESGCEVLECEDDFDKSLLIDERIDFIVSYRYRHIICKDVVGYMKDRIINLHISLLPWNRGSDPNLWSFLEDTPKGATIHHIDEQVDTGDIISQREVFFDSEVNTLVTTYRQLNEEILELFRQQWPTIMRGEAGRQKQPVGGSFHRARDKKKYEHLFIEKGWGTPVRELIGKALPAVNRFEKSHEH